LGRKARVAKRGSAERWERKASAACPASVDFKVSLVNKVPRVPLAIGVSEAIPAW
jgi:hypothetical protein